MKSNHSFMAQELPEEEMKMLYSLLGKTLPKEKKPTSKFRLNFRFMKKRVADDNFQE